MSKPSEKQQAVLDYMAYRGKSSYTVEEVLATGKPAGGFDNEANFVMHMLRNGQLRLVPGPAVTEKEN